MHQGWEWELSWSKICYFSKKFCPKLLHASTYVRELCAITYGKPPPTLATYIQGASQVEAIEATLTTRDSILQTLKKKLEKAQHMMKLYADKRRLPRDTTARFS